MNLRWISNTYDPGAVDLKWQLVLRSGQTREEALQEHKQWLKGKVIGAPKQVDKPDAPSADKLRSWGMVGVYVEENE